MYSYKSTTANIEKWHDLEISNLRITNSKTFEPQMSKSFQR